MTQLSSQPTKYTVPDDLTFDTPPDNEIPESTIHDYAPQSFWLSKDAEFDWFDRNAFLERKESIKGNSNPIVSPMVNPSYSNANPSSISVFLKPKASNKTMKNCKLASIFLFPKRLDSVGKELEPALVSMMEPSSPKVSCLGRVRSKRCPMKKKKKKKKNDIPESEPVEQVTRKEKTGKVRNLGFVSCIRSLFRCVYGGKESGKSMSGTNNNKVSEYSGPGRHDAVCDDFGYEQEVTVDLRGFGGTRFSSG